MEDTPYAIWVGNETPSIEHKATPRHSLAAPVSPVRLNHRVRATTMAKRAQAGGEVQQPAQSTGAFRGETEDTVTTNDKSTDHMGIARATMQDTTCAPTSDYTSLAYRPASADAIGSATVTANSPVPSPSMLNSPPKLVTK